MTDFTFPLQAMRCGQHEAQKLVYEMVVAESGKAFFVPPEGTYNRAGEIHCTDSANWDKAGQGYGGDTVKLPLLDGSVFELKGGWHTNSEHLLRETGMDIQDQHHTLVCIGLKRGKDKYPHYGVADVLYCDEEPTLGRFNRGDLIGQAFADGLNRPVYCGSQSLGGGSYGWRWPAGTTHRDWESVDDNWKRKVKENA